MLTSLIAFALADDGQAFDEDGHDYGFVDRLFPLLDEISANYARAGARYNADRDLLGFDGAVSSGEPK